MAVKPVVFHPEAAAEYEAAVQWYLERNEWIAGRFVQELSEAVVAQFAQWHRHS